MGDFDKEKERQRLREKYEQDEKKRDSTQRMSELLLKGATMTNKHCPQCGDPLFRYNNQEFCPTCQTESQSVNAADADSVNDTEEVAQEAVSETASSAPQPTDANGKTASTDANEEATTASTANADQQAGGTQQTSGSQQVGRTQQPSRRRTGDASLTAARESLVETLTWAANEAAATDDPHRAKEYLAAAREAAEAIAALDR